MEVKFEKEKMIRTALSPYEKYCVGYPGSGNYLTALIIGTGVWQISFSHSGSDNLDRIVAFDRAEVSGAYIGQINMITVSSFCGPEGLIWGHDLAKKEDIPLSSSLLSYFKKHLQEFGEIQIRNGENLRKAAIALFGTNEKKHFPFLPGTHVPSASKFYTKSGPAILYAAIAIGIPENRNEAACVLMEDVGEIPVSEGGIMDPIKEKILLNAIRSVIAVGKNQEIQYREIFVDLVTKEVLSGQIGCILIAMPYFLLAQKAFTNELVRHNLEEWIGHTKRYFLCNQSS